MKHEMKHEMKPVLTIAGSDCSGGAGIQADLKTMTMFGVYGMSVITALTAQNTTGVYGIMDVPPEFTANQLDCVFTDIVPQAVKIGMVSQTGTIEVIAEKLKKYQAANVVVDPVMVSSTGSRLLAEDAVAALGQLFSLASVITPNIPEAEILSGLKIQGAADMEAAASGIADKYGCAVLVKGGHQIEEANDLLCCEGTLKWFKGRRIRTTNTHGTGCTLSSAIASCLALGFTMEQSVEWAKEYLFHTLDTGLDLGKGSGPVNHCFAISAGGDFDWGN